MYGSVVKFYYTFTDRGLNTFTSAVNFTALATSRAGAAAVLIPLETFSFVALPLAPAGALVQGTQRVAGSLRGTGRRLFQAAGGAYAEASALAAFAPTDKNATTPAAPPPTTTFGSW